MGKAALSDPPLLRHQLREFAATHRATVKLTPKARNSRNIVLPRFHCLS
jgi:hypothetical protein